ncbi:MAG: 3-dehydroquinate synthase family protein [Phycisphaerales bacterium]
MKPRARSAKPPAAPTTRRIDVRIKAGPLNAAARYEVLVGTGVLPGALSALKDQPRAVLVVIDSGLGKPLVEPVLRELDRAKVRWGVCVVPATEADKNLLTAERGLAEAGRLRLERGDVVLTLGGGITTDVGGFIASIYRRGVRTVHCPTTLLAMVDAAIGGKTAVNLSVPGDALSSSKPRLVKNLVGTFHQPVRVVCDVAALATLPARELRAGLAECIKHSLLGRTVKDPSLLRWIEERVPAILACDARTMVELVARNAAAKARVVMADPLEASPKPDGGRMALNLGHTFAHAMETLPGLSWPVRDHPDRPAGASAAGTQIGPLKHGEAVGLGLLAACRCAASLKLIKPAAAESLAGLVTRCGLPTAVRGLSDTGAIMERMMDDKKTSGGKLRLILPTTGGGCKVVVGPPPKAVAGAIDSLRLV